MSVRMLMKERKQVKVRKHSLKKFRAKRKMLEKMVEMEKRPKAYLARFGMLKFIYRVWKNKRIKKTCLMLQLLAA